jgi:hypothetical protein
MRSEGEQDLKRDDSKCTLGCQGCFLVVQNIKAIRRMAANPLILWLALESNVPRGFFMIPGMTIPH